MGLKKDLTCDQRVNKEMENELETLRKLWKLHQEGDEEGDEDLGRFEEHGLCFDYVAPGTFNDQDQGYFRYQISTGGPGDEFRFYVNPDYSCYCVEYWFLDWYDGAHRELSGEDKDLLLEIYNGFFRDCGCCDSEFEKATKNA